MASNENQPTEPLSRSITVKSINGYIETSGFEETTQVPVFVGFRAENSTTIPGTVLMGNMRHELNVELPQEVKLCGIVAQVEPLPNARNVSIQILFGENVMVPDPPAESTANVRVVLSNYQITSLTDPT